MMGVGVGCMDEKHITFENALDLTMGGGGGGAGPNLSYKDWGLPEGSCQGLKYGVTIYKTYQRKYF